MSASLARSLVALPHPPGFVEAEARLREALGDGFGDLPKPAHDLCAAAAAASPYLMGLFLKAPEQALADLQAAPAATLASIHAEILDGMPETEADLMARLRVMKRRIALVVALADLGRVQALHETTAQLTAFADAVLETALRFCIADARRQGRFTGDVEACGLVFIAMGKHGAGELNYSSDIDVIALFDPEAGVLADGVEPAPFWVRLVQRVVKILQTRTADGYVFRTDLRLRPDPGSTPVAISLPGALNYYESMGQNWERAAFIKARPAAGDLALGRRFLDAITPFVWRKYLDYAAISDVASIKRQMHGLHGAGERVAGHDLKRGAGGIREVEFFAQTQQLVAGGRDVRLRVSRTVEALAALHEADWIDARVRDEMTAAYTRLRDVEHRVQMLRDEQTHTIPQDDVERAEVATLAGFDALEGFDASVAETLATVRGHAARLFAAASSLGGETGSLVFTGDEDDPGTLETLANLGYADPKGVSATVRAWHFGRYPAMRSAAAREQLTSLMPALIEAFARHGGDAALRAFDELLRHLPAGVQLFAMLTANGHLLDLLARLLGGAPALRATIARRPHVLDALLEPRFFGELPQADGFAHELDAALALARGEEDGLDRLRIFSQEQRTLVSVRLLAGAIRPDEAGRAFSDLADAVIGGAMRVVTQAFRADHGDLAGGRFAVVAMGRLGAQAMTATSDIDLLLLYDHDAGVTASDGPKPLAPSLYANRLTRRLVAALSAPTGQGVAYPVDLRLRPSGNAGPLATSLDAFARYQREEAWTWEHMALTRARPVAGDPALMREVESVVGDILAQPRDAARVLADVAEMRTRVRREKGSGDPWTLKTAAGGLMEIEFVGQALALISGEATGDVAGSLARARSEYMPIEARERLVEAWAFQSDLNQGLRVALGEGAAPRDASGDLKAFLAALMDAPDFEALEARLREHQSESAAVADLLFEPQPVAAARG